MLLSRVDEVQESVEVLILQMIGGLVSAKFILTRVYDEYYI